MPCDQPDEDENTSLWQHACLRSQSPTKDLLCKTPTMAKALPALQTNVADLTLQTQVTLIEQLTPQVAEQITSNETLARFRMAAISCWDEQH